MSIARMKKLSAVGLISQREILMNKLMALGLVEIRDSGEKLNEEEWCELVRQDSDEEAISVYESRLSRVNQALNVLDKHGNEKTPLLRTRRLISHVDFQRTVKEEWETERIIEKLNLLFDRHNQLSNLINKAETLKLSLTPWAEYSLPLEENGTKKVDLILGLVPSGVDVHSFKEEMEDKVPLSLVQMVHRDEDQGYFYIICEKTQRELADDVFRNFGFSKVSFGDLKGTAKDNILEAEKNIENYIREKEKVEQDIGSLEKDRHKLETYHDRSVIEKDRAAIRGKLLITEKSFAFEGWLPAAAEDQVERLLAEMDCYYKISEPEKDEKTPVLLLNGRFSMPFEAITKLYALPESGSVDATPFFSLSYAIFFGMMLGDGAYGIIMALMTGFILKKYKLEGMKYQMIKLFFYCGIATAFWGAMFGGWFGDIVEVVGRTFFNADISIPAIWFNPLDDPMKLLIFCFILGGIHLFIGMGLSAWLSIKDGRPWDAIFDVGLWYLLLIGATLLLTGFVPQLAKWMSIIGALGIVLTAGRNKKGIGKIVGGFGSLYGITGYLSDVLSYSRLLALGLASSVIASVVNTMGSFGGSGIKGLLLMLFAFVIGHTYNFAINGLGSFVHSCRLQYVEFFGKFYVSGGEAFKPFGENTKYIAIQREES